MKKLLIIAFILLAISACSNNGTKSETKDHPSEETTSSPMKEWQVMDEIDDFGEKTGSKYICLEGGGTLTNAAATGAKAACVLTVSGIGPSLAFYDYGRHSNKDGQFYSVKFKQGEQILECEMFNSTYGICVAKDEDKPKILDMIKKGGTLRISAIAHREYTADVQYTFSFNTDGYEYASQFITK